MLNENQYGGRVVVTCDSGAGSSGKGCLNAWLADTSFFHIATNNWATNAGHYTELDDGTRILVQHIPSAFINPNTALYINAGASLDLKILFDEIDMLESHGYDIRSRLTIHPHANVITQANKDLEKEILKTGSTFKGCGAALAQKVMRQQALAKDYDELAPFILDRTRQMHDDILKGISILVEGSQGIDLDLNHAEYPYTTSRSTTPAQLVADAGIGPHLITNAILNTRTNPIRISNVSAANEEEICYTGNYWDAKEIDWQTVAQKAGYEWEEFKELYNKALITSVTKKIRRVFEFPVERAKYNHALVGGDVGDNVLYSLNFVNFIDKDVTGVRTKEEVLTPRIMKWLEDNLFKVTSPSAIRWIRTGPRHSQIVEFPEGIPV